MKCLFWIGLFELETRCNCCNSGLKKYIVITVPAAQKINNVTRGERMQRMVIDRTANEFLSDSVWFWFLSILSIRSSSRGGKGGLSVACENRVLRQVFLFRGVFCFKGIGAQISSMRKKDKGLLNSRSSVATTSNGSGALRSEIDETMREITYR